MGPVVVALFWALFAFFAFVPFGRQTRAPRILAFTAATYLLLLLRLRALGLIGLATGGSAALSLALLAGAYAVPLRKDLPQEALALNRDLSASHGDRYEYARALFWDIERRFTGPVREYLLQPHKVFFVKSARRYWERDGYVPSHLQAQLYRALLLASGRFGEEEVRYETGRCYNSPHGYVVIHHPERPIYADLWAAEHFADYRFGQLVDMPSCSGLLAEAAPEEEPFERPA